MKWGGFAEQDWLRELRLNVAVHASLARTTGISRYTRHLLAELGRGFPELGVRVWTYPSRPDRPDWLPASVGYRRPRLPGRVQQALVRRGVSPRWLFGLRDCDLFHFTEPGARLPLRPSVLTVYDVAWRVFGPEYQSVIPADWVRATEAAIAAADHLLAISRATADDLVRSGVPADRVTVTPLAADERFFAADAAEGARVRERYRLPERFVLYVGLLNVRKGVPVLADAMDGLPPNAGGHLVLAGPPPEEGLAFWKLDRPWATHLGYFPDEDLPGLYAAAAAVVLPARLEGFGLPLIEAMAAGTPVLATDQPVFREIAGDATRFFPRDDAEALGRLLEAVFRDRIDAAGLAKAARVRAAEFSWRGCAEATVEGYRLAARGARR